MKQLDNNIEEYRKRGMDKIIGRPQDVKFLNVVRVFMILIILTSFGFIMFRPAITGRFIGVNEANVENLELIVDESSVYTISLSTLPEGAVITSIGLTGRSTGDGDYEVWLEYEDEMYLVLQKPEGDAGLIPITGFVGFGIPTEVAIDEENISANVTEDDVTLNETSDNETTENVTDEPEETGGGENITEEVLDDEMVNLTEANLTEDNVSVNVTDEETQVEENETETDGEGVSTEFVNRCADTCALFLKDATFKLHVVVVGGVVLELDSITYSYDEGSVDNFTDVINDPPVLVKFIPDLNVSLNETVKVNLSEHFEDETEMAFSYDPVAGADMDIYGEMLSISLTEEAEGEVFTYVVASDGVQSTVSNTFGIYRADPIVKSPVADEGLTQYPAEIGKPVRWSRVVVTEEEDIGGALRVELHPESELKSVKKDGDMPGFGAKSFSIMELGVLELDNNVEEEGVVYEVEYETPAPELIEKKISDTKKEVIVFSELHYENILTYVKVDEYPVEAFKVYRTTEGKEEIDGNESYNLTYIDSDNDTLIDMVQWITPHLSNESFEIEISVLNVQSYPTVGDVWEVRFETIGKANLTITAFDGTTWADSGEDEDLEFLSLKCGGQVQEYEWINDTVFVEDYECNSTGYETSKVITSGKHHLRFDFGPSIAYAHNLAWGSCRVESGTTSIGVGQKYVTLGTEITNTSQAFLLMDPSGTSTAQYARHHAVSGRIHNSTDLSFVRGNAGNSAQISYQVVECFDGEFNVQNGSVLVTGTTNTDSITSIDDDQSIVIPTYNTTSFYPSRNLARSYLTAGNTVEFNRSTSSDSVWVVYQVVEFMEGVNVYNGTVALGSGSLNASDTLPANVDTSRSWILCNYDASNDGPSHLAVGCELFNETTVYFHRYTATSETNNIQYYVVEFPESKVDVQRGSEAFAGSSCSDDNRCDNNITISSVNISRAFSYTTQSVNTEATAALPTHMWVELVETPSVLRTTNWRSGGTTADDNKKYWQVIEFVGTDNTIDCDEAVTSSQTLVQNLTCSGTGVQVGSDDIVIDCGGYAINYSTDGVLGYGVNVTGYDNVTIQNCQIFEGNATTNSKYSVYFGAGAENGSVVNNTIDTVNELINYNIRVEDGSDNIVIANNTFTTVYSEAIHTHNVSSITIENNTIDFGLTGSHGVFLSKTNSSTVLNNNIFNNNMTSGVSAIYINSDSHFNSITNNTIDNVSHAFSVLTTDSIPSHNNFTNNIILNASMRDLYIGNPGSNYTYLIDQPITNYSIKPSLLYFKDTDEGEIKFLDAINGTGVNLSAEIMIESNLVTVNDSNEWLNKSANITLFGLSTGMSDPQIMRNEEDICNSTTTPACYNFTDLNAGTVSFNVSSWSNYSVQDQDVISCGDNITTSKTFTSNMTCSGDALIIGANDITVDCAGFTINYSIDGVLGYGINNTGEYTNVTVQNCNIVEGNATTDYKHAIYADDGDDWAVQNNVIETTGDRSYGIYMDSYGLDISIINNTVNSSGYYAYGIFLSSGNHDSAITNNTIFTSGNIADGVHAYNSDNLVIYNNTIKITNSAEGINVDASDDYNISHNTINSTHASSQSIFIYRVCDGGVIEHNNIIQAGGTAIQLATHASQGTPADAIIRNNTLSNVAGLELYFSGAYSPNGTTLIDQPINDYEFVGAGGIVYFKDTGEGEIRYLEPINGSGTNLSAEVSIENNLASVNDSNEWLNKSANITFYGFLASMSDPQIMRNGEDICNSTTTPACYNFTDLNAVTVRFNVSSWSNYSVQDQAQLVCGGTVTESGNLTEDLDCDNTALYIGADDIIIGCGGNEIDFGKTGFGYGINNSAGYDNVTIRDCFFRGANTAVTGQHAIYFVDSDNSWIYNNTMNATQGGGSGVVLSNVNNFSVEDNRIDVQGSGGMAINVTLGDNLTVISNNATKTTIALSGFSFINLTNSNISDNEVNVTASSDAIVLDLVSSRNTISSNTIDAEDGSAIRFTGTKGEEPGDNNISGNTFGVVSDYEIHFDADSDYNYLIDQPVDSYNFVGVGSVVYFKDSGEGELKFLEAISGTGVNLSGEVKIASNSIWVNGTNTNLNKSANLTFYSVFPDGSGKALMDDSECPANVCGPIIENNHDYFFNVTGFSNYSVGGICGDVLTASEVLENNMTCNGTALYIGSDNVVLDCEGYNINYSIDGVLGYGVNNSDGYDNITVRNCNIYEGNATQNIKFAIRFSNVNPGVIDNNNISMVGASTALALAGSSNINVTNNTVTTSSAVAHGIYLLNTVWSRIEDNYVNISSASSDAIQLWQNSSYNIIRSNDISLGRWGMRLGQGAEKYPQYNNFTDNTMNGGLLDLKVDDPDVDYNYFIDQPINDYDIDDSILYFKDTGEGEVRFLEAINGTGTNLSAEIKIESNYIEVNGSKDGLNKSANLTFYDLSFTGTPRPYKDGAECDSSICGDFRNVGDDYYYNVTEFSVYNVTDVCGRSYDDNYVMTYNITCPGTAVTFSTKSDFDCDGYTVNYSNAGTDSTYGFYSTDLANIEIHDCIIVEGNSTGNNKFAVRLINTELPNVYNNNITTVGTNSVGLSIDNATRGVLSDNRIFTSGQSANGINYKGDDASVRNNNITTTGPSSSSAIVLSDFNGGNISFNIINSTGSAFYGSGNYLSGWSQSNYIEDNTILYAGGHGIDLQGQVADNIFSRNNFSSVAGSGIHLHWQNYLGLELYAERNNFTNNTFGDIGGWELNTTKWVNGTGLIDQNIRNYSIDDPGFKLTYRNSSHGEVVFTDPVNGSGDLLDDIFNLSANSIVVNGEHDGFNKSADLSFYNIGITGTLFALMDEALCPGSICGAVSSSGTTKSYTVQHFTNYSLTNNTLPVVENVTLMSTGSNVTTDNLTLDFDSYDDDTGHNVTNITDWRIDGVSMAVINAPFDEQVSTTGETRDYSTYVNNGTLDVYGGGESGPSWVTTGNIGGAIDFDGTDDMIDFGDIDEIDNAAELTVSVWVYHDDADKPYYIFTKASETAGVRFWRDEDSVAGRTDTYSVLIMEPSGSNVTLTGATDASPATTWTHVAFTYEQDSTTGLRLFVNGVEDANSPADTSGITSISSGTTAALLGKNHSGGFFNGKIDELLVFNRSLSREQIFQIYNAGAENHSLKYMVSNETSNGENWSVAVTPNDKYDDGGTVISDGVQLGNTPSTVSFANVTPLDPDTNSTLTCNNGTVSDIDGDTVTLYYNWSLNGTWQDVNSQTLDETYTKKNHNWSCSITPCDDQDCGTPAYSDNVTINNSLPAVPDLVSPSNGNTTLFWRNVTFDWNASYDPDEGENIDSVTYELNITPQSCGTPQYETGIATSGYTLPYDLEVDCLFFWEVRAYDGTGYSAWSDTWNFTIEPTVIISFVGDNSTDFGSQEPKESNDTSDNDPSPLLIQNDGNIPINVSLYALDGLWTSVGINTSYFQYKADVSEADSFSMDHEYTQTDWAPICGYGTENKTYVFGNFSYNNSKDAGEIELRIQVPSAESAAAKSSVLTVVGES